MPPYDFDRDPDDMLSAWAAGGIIILLCMMALIIGIYLGHLWW